MSQSEVTQHATYTVSMPGDSLVIHFRLALDTGYWLSFSVKARPEEELNKILGAKITKDLYQYLYAEFIEDLLEGVSDDATKFEILQAEREIFKKFAKKLVENLHEVKP